MLLRLTTLAAAGLVAASSAAFTPAPEVDWAMVAKIREEGLQRSRVMDFESYMTDVLGARLTLSRDMQRARKVADAVLVELASKEDLAKYKGTLKGKAVLAPAPPPES